MTKRTVVHHKKVDPFLQRESEKYGNPIPSREFIMQILAEAEEPLPFDSICSLLNINIPSKVEAFKRRLKAMISDGQIIKNRKACFVLVDKLDLISGRVVFARDGNGFLLTDKGNKRIFLNPKQLRFVLPEDRVLISINIFNKQEEGIVVEILERGTTQVVGRYQEKQGIAFVTSINKDILQEIIIPHNKNKNAKIGQIVVVAITNYPSKEDKDYNVYGEVIDILGERLDPDMEIKVAIRAHEIPHEWSDEVLEEAKDFSTEITSAMLQKRKILTDLPFVTIDGEDAKDFDDAVCCIPLKGTNNGFTLYVAIADVSFYVKKDSAIDLEAQKRGNSVYFPGYVVPMLPEVLSNDLCSLKPNVERFAVVCEIKINSKGKINDYKFYNALIKSKARLTYNQVFNMLEGKSDAIPELLPHLQDVYKIFELLLKQKKLRGALDFDSVETQIIFNEHKKIEKIVPVERNYAHMMIEECMLAANFCASQFLSGFKIPILYRIHEVPDEEKMKTLREFLKRYGCNIKLKSNKAPTPLDFAKILESIKGEPEEAIIETLVLRSLKQAVYSRKNVGHFGLAYDAYVHFTSPIRRFPDLVIHRAIKAAIAHNNAGSYSYGQFAIDNLCNHCSMTERRADTATREAIYSLKCSFMKDKVGQVFNGVISNVTNFGLFVALDKVYVEGLLHVTSLVNDYYQYDPLRFVLKGKRSGKVYKLGNKIKVLVARVDVEEGEIHFELA